MRNKWGKHIRIVSALMLGILAVNSFPKGRVQAVETGDDKTYALTIELAGKESGEGDEKYLDDLAGAEATVDFYRVATLIPDPNYDTYSFDSLVDFGKDLSKYEVLAEMKAEDWEALNAVAAEAVIGHEDDFKKESLDLGKSASIDLNPGLWLVVPHDTAEVETEEKGLPEDEIVTLVHTPRYTYLYRPQLIALPATDTNNTSGTWLEESTATLKPERIDRYAKIKVTKNLEKYETTTPATFVFTVKASYEEDMSDVIYENVVGLTFSSASSETHLFDDIPADSYVQVTESYNGSSYTKTLSADDIRHIDAYVTGEEIQEFKFSNKYEETSKSGSGINNHFEKNENDKTKWNYAKEYKTGDYTEDNGGTEE